MTLRCWKIGVHGRSYSRPGWRVKTTPAASSHTWVKKSRSLILLLHDPRRLCSAQDTRCGALMQGKKCDTWTIFECRFTAGVFSLLILDWQSIKEYIAGDSNSRVVKIKWLFPSQNHFIACSRFTFCSFSKGEIRTFINLKMICFFPGLTNMSRRPLNLNDFVGKTLWLETLSHMVLNLELFLTYLVWITVGMVLNNFCTITLLLKSTTSSSESFFGKDIFFEVEKSPSIGCDSWLKPWLPQDDMATPASETTTTYVTEKTVNLLQKMNTNWTRLYFLAEHGMTLDCYYSAVNSFC